MQVLVIGSTKGTGNALVRQLLADGMEVRAMVRDPAQAGALEALGATVVVGDLEGDLDGVADGVDAVAFCAGSGSKTGPDATLRVDLHGAVRIID
ncbi:MAG: SDR family NAD(P)-dependent oxidoreductase, partial [Nitriliruptor sp.]